MPGRVVGRKGPVVGRKTGQPAAIAERIGLAEKRIPGVRAAAFTAPMTAHGGAIARVLRCRQRLVARQSVAASTPEFARPLALRRNDAGVFHQSTGAGNQPPAPTASIADTVIPANASDDFVTSVPAVQAGSAPAAPDLST